ncbi:hypothetical protein NMY22_g10762 [Coprinellus aureogranulatus]|nr:hypothetical protein NMY22_g10762 [Coprinellus aureogranulatus]
MDSGTPETLRALTKQIRSKRKATYTSTGTLGVPQEFDNMEDYLPLILPSVLGRPKKHVFAYPARIVSAIPEVAREHAGLALANAITQTVDRDEAILRICEVVGNRVLDGARIESTALAEILEETYDQLSNRAFVGKAKGDLEELEGVPNHLRRRISEAFRELLLDEWKDAFACPILLDKLINVSSFYGYLYSRGMIYAHEFLEPLNTILEEYTPGSLDLLMIAVIYLMSRATMSQERRAIPLEYWHTVERQLNDIEGRLRQTRSHNNEDMELDTVELLCGQTPVTTLLNPGAINPSDADLTAVDDQQESTSSIGSKILHFFGLAKYTSIPPPVQAAPEDPLQTAIDALRSFITEFEVADTHAALFRPHYPCGFVEFYADPPPMYSVTERFGRTFSRQWWYLNMLGDRLKRWANVKGIDRDIYWGETLNQVYDDDELEYNEAVNVKEDEGEECCNGEAGDDGEEIADEEIQGKPSPKFMSIDFCARTPYDPHYSPSLTNATEMPKQIWMRRGIEAPQFQWKPRRAQLDCPYPKEHQPKKPANMGIYGSTPCNGFISGAMNVDEAPGPFLIRASEGFIHDFSTGSHHLVPPVDPRVSYPGKEYLKAMQKCDIVWRIGANGFYKAELVDRAEKGGMKPERWTLRQDDPLTPRTCS